MTLDRKTSIENAIASVPTKPTMPGATHGGKEDAPGAAKAVVGRIVAEIRALK